MVLGRIISYVHAEHFSLVPLKWMTGIFVAGDVIAFVMQAAGEFTPNMGRGVRSHTFVERG